jgi:CHAT domain-containing protein
VLYLEAKEIYRKNFSNKPAEYASLLHYLAQLYEAQKLYSKAEALYLQALQILKNTFGENHPNYVPFVHYLAKLYDFWGKYDKAESLFAKVEKYYDESLILNTPEYATFISNRASLYQSQGLYTKAERLYRRAMQIREKLFGTNHPLYATSLQKVGGIQAIKQQYIGALSSYGKAARINRKIYGKDHPRFAWSVYLMALIASKFEIYDGAKKMFLDALRIQKMKVGIYNANYASYLSGLANMYIQQKEYSKGDSLYLQVIKIKKKVFGENHPSYTMSLSNLAFMYNEQSAYSKAQPLYLQSIRAKIQELKRNSLLLSEKEKKAYIEGNRGYFNNFQNFVLDYVGEEGVNEKTKVLIKELFNLLLNTKAQLLSSKQRLLALILDKIKEDVALQKKYKEYVNLKNVVAQNINLTVAEKKRRGVDIGKSLEKINDLEKSLYAAIGADTKNTTKAYSFETVRNCLEANEAAIEILRLEKWNKQKKKVDIYYVFFVVTPQSKASPHMMILKNGKQLEKTYIKNYKQAILAKKEDSESYDKFWKPIGDFLKAKNITKVYITPDGVYNQLNINTLKGSKGRYVEDEVSVCLVTNLRDLIKAGKQLNVSVGKPQSSNGVVLFGRPLYDLAIKDLQKGEKAYKKSNIDDWKLRRGALSTSRRKDQKRSGWSDLPGTEQEVNAIAQVLSSVKQLRVIKKLGSEAMEVAVKNVKQPKVLHIATHGFFIEQFKAPVQVQKEEVVFDNFSRGGAESDSINSTEPMLRSGIVLAGAGSYERAKLKPNTEDGILTAYEASQMDLRGTELVVLSACETGLGDVANGEGVYGLQRAFIAAGAKTVLLSLWKVDDNATRLLMSKFYEEWIKNKQTKRAAFKIAQAYLKNYKSSAGKPVYAAPYYWGAFQMIGIDN